MKAQRLLLISALLLTGCDMKKTKYDYSNAVNVIILSGQSNAEGQTLIANLPTYFTDNDKPTDLYSNGFSDVKLSYMGKDNSTNKDNPIDGKFVETKLGYGASSLRFGPELPIAEKITGKTSRPTYIIKFTYSGAGFYGADGNNFTSPSAATTAKPTGKLYNDMIDFIYNSLYLITLEGYNPVIRTLVWIQGEADGYSSTGAANYKHHFDCFFSDLTTEFEDYTYEHKKENVALIDATISDKSIWDYYPSLNNAKRQISEEAENHYLINTLSTGLDLRLNNDEHGGGDAYHYTIDSTIRLGHEVGNIINSKGLLNF